MSYLDYVACEERTKILDGTIDDGTSEGITCSNLNLLVHQKLLVNKMLDYEDNYLHVKDHKEISTIFGVLGDKPGTGKTYVIAALLENKPQYMNTYGNVFQYGDELLQVKKTDSNLQYVPINIIVVPHYLINQWYDVFANIPNYVYKIAKKTHLYSFKLQNCIPGQCVLLSSSFYCQFSEMFHHCKFSRIIFDEADHIETPGIYKPRAHFYWFVTASMINLLFPSGEYYIKQSGHIQIKTTEGIRKRGYIKSIFTDLERKSVNSYLKHSIFRCTEDLIQQSINFPKVKKEVIVCEDPLLVRVLHGHMPKEILERLNADDIHGAKERLASQTQESLLNIITNKYTTEIHNRNQKLICLQSSILPDVAKNEKIKEETQQIEKLQNTWNSIQERIKESQCPICYDVAKTSVTLTCCHHVYCSSCISQQFERNLTSCAVCREPIKIDRIFSQTTNRTKINSLQQLLSNSKESFLIFSSYETNEFQQLPNFKNNSIRGNVTQINKMLYDFNQGNVQYLILNPNHYGNGLNLQKAAVIVFYHKVSPDIEEQVIGRACRYGNQKEIEVKYLYYENEKTN